MAWYLIKHRYNFASFYCSSVCVKGLRRTTTHTLRIPDVWVGKEEEVQVNVSLGLSPSLLSALYRSE